MSGGENPYPEFLLHALSEIGVPSDGHWLREDVYGAGGAGRQVIRTVIRSEKGMVLVFSEDGEQIPEYEGLYERVRARILRDAPPGATFYHVSDNPRTVPREDW